MEPVGFGAGGRGDAVVDVPLETMEQGKGAVVVEIRSEAA
ncbi:hypothetical protein ACP70R_049074 [Stipagrostis hirtigluma subsp. patula]